jgi:hypothetical protein
MNASSDPQSIFQATELHHAALHCLSVSDAYSKESGVKALAALSQQQPQLDESETYRFGSGQ